RPIISVFQSPSGIWGLRNPNNQSCLACSGEECFNPLRGFGGYVTQAERLERLWPARSFNPLRGFGGYVTSSHSASSGTSRSSFNPLRGFGGYVTLTHEIHARRR